MKFAAQERAALATFSIAKRAQLERTLTVERLQKVAMLSMLTTDVRARGRASGRRRVRCQVSRAHGTLREAYQTRLDSLKAASDTFGRSAEMSYS